jgi:mannose PTS system EIIA component
MERIGCIIISHGQVANELVAAAEAVVGDLSHVMAVSIGWHDDVELARKEIERAISTVSDGGSVLMMTDMFGGTPTNIAATFLDSDKVEIVTGVNLPMVIKLATVEREMTLSELAKEVEAAGKESICRAGELLAPAKGRKDG